MKNNFLLMIIIIFFLQSCAGLGGKRSSNSDEFLIEKKNPLVMPPDIDDLPEPDQKGTLEENQINDNNFKETLSSKNSASAQSNSQTSATLKESIIKKIEQ